MAVEVHVVVVPCAETAPGALVGGVFVEDNDGGVHRLVVQLLAGVLGWLESLDVISAGEEPGAGGVDDGLGVHVHGKERDLLFIGPQLEWVGQRGGAGLWVVWSGRSAGRLGRGTGAGEVGSTFRLSCCSCLAGGWLG